jgi:hypothetical protein
MVKKVYNISILAWLALLLIVFSCESEAEKEQVNIMADPAFKNQIKRILDTVSIKVEAIPEDSCKKDVVCRRKNYESLEKLLATCKNDPYYPCSSKAYNKVKRDLKEWE